MAKREFNYENTDYVDVAARIVEFRNRYPEGCLQPADLARPYRIETIGDLTFVVYTAAAYRNPEDPRPGIGIAWEVFPGRTPYTRNSELMNAETSAWGRAIIAVGAADSKKGIASAEEVRNRQAERDTPPRTPTKQATDHAWLDDVERRIAAASSMQELATLSNEVDGHRRAGTCEDVHYSHLWEVGKNREAELAGGPPRNKDGSLSRSRMSDDELAKAGAMTGPEKREHNRMVKDTMANPKLAERSTGADPADPWLDGRPE